MLQRVESGIPGLDHMIQGGFPFPSTIMVAGEPGTGKTTLAVQSLKPATVETNPELSLLAPPGASAVESTFQDVTNGISAKAILSLHYCAINAQYRSNG